MASRSPSDPSHFPTHDPPPPTLHPRASVFSLGQEGWAHRFFSSPLKSSSPASSDFPSPLQPWRGDVNFSEVPQTHLGSPGLPQSSLLPRGTAGSRVTYVRLNSSRIGVES